MPLGISASHKKRQKNATSVVTSMVKTSFLTRFLSYSSVKKARAEDQTRDQDSLFCPTTGRLCCFIRLLRHAMPPPSILCWDTFRLEHTAVAKGPWPPPRLKHNRSAWITVSINQTLHHLHSHNDKQPLVPSTPPYDAPDGDSRRT